LEKIKAQEGSRRRDTERLKALTVEETAADAMGRGVGEIEGLDGKEANSLSTTRKERQGNCVQRSRYGLEKGG